MSRRDNGLEISASRPDPETLVPIERDVLTGKAIPLDHRDKQRHRDRTNRDPRQQPVAGSHPAAIPRPRLSAIAVAGTATAVVVIAGGIFLLSRHGGASTPSQAAVGAPIPSPTSVATQLVSPAGATPGTIILTSAAANPLAVSTSPVVTESGAPRGSRSTASSAPTTASASTIDPAGFNGTYHGVYKYVDGTGTGALVIGTSTTATLKVRTSCSSRSVCSTVIVINGVKQSAITANRGSWSHTFEGTEACRDFYTRKLIGGSYRYRDAKTYRAAAGSGSPITTLTGTERYTQLTKCPQQAQALLTSVVQFKLTRTGP